MAGLSIVCQDARRSQPGSHVVTVTDTSRRHRVTAARTCTLPIIRKTTSPSFINTAAARGAPRHDQRKVGGGSTFESDSLANQSTPRSTYTS